MEAGLKAIAAYRRGVVEECEPPYAGMIPKKDTALGDARLPVLSGGWSLAGVRRAARYTDGWITGPLDTFEALAEMARVYRDECKQLNREPYVAVLREAWLAETDDQAIADYGSFVLNYHRTYLRRGKVYDARFDPWINRIRSADELTLDDVLPNRVLLGSQDTWNRELDRLCGRVEPDEIILRLRHVDGPSPEKTLKAMESISKAVMPRFA
jgi:alkanesulfonate monooxygenase SsuD/methylene tetrahydromethanopterin reductase-like flavin-dependent oxidoreductase (luciferase family)